MKALLHTVPASACHYRWKSDFSSAKMLLVWSALAAGTVIPPGAALQASEDITPPKIEIVSEPPAAGVSISPDAKEEVKKDKGGLVAWWSFDENTGTAAHDESGNANDATVHGAEWRAGKIGFALSFDGEDDYVDCGKDESLYPAHITVEAWVKPYSTDESAIIAGYVSYKGFFLLNRRFSVYSGTEKQADASYLLEVKEWAHIVGTYDGTTVKVYKNGRFVSSADQERLFPSPLNVILGKASHHDGAYFKGLIDEVKIYNIALSQEEIYERWKAVEGIRPAEGRAQGLFGTTCILEVKTPPKGIDVLEIGSIGDLSPGGGNEMRIRIANLEGQEKRLALRMGVQGEGDEPVVIHEELKLEPGAEGAAQLEYPLEPAGTHHLTFTIADLESMDVLYAASGSLRVPPLLATDYGYRLPGSEGLDLWWCESTYKVGRKRGVPSVEGRRIEIRAARNEYEPFQLVLRSGKDIEGIEISLNDLKGPGGETIGGERFQINLVEYVPVEIRTDAFGCVGDWPDPLPRYEGPFGLVAERNQPIWFTVHVPEHARAGDYNGTIQVSGEGMDPIQIPIQLNVRAFTLPEETHTRTAYGIWMNDFAFHGCKTREELARVHDLYMRNFAAHRISPILFFYFGLVDYIGWKVVSPGEVEIDFTELDRLLDYHLEELHFTTYRYAMQGYPNSPSPEFEKAAKLIDTKTIQHLEEKGWLDKFYFYLWDEPAASIYPQLKKEGEAMKKDLPGLKRLVTIQPDPALHGAVDIWVPLTEVYGQYRQDLEARRKAGDEIWWYVCSTPRYPYFGHFIDHPAINQRIHFWMMQKYEITGTLYWTVNYNRGIDLDAMDANTDAYRHPWHRGVDMYAEARAYRNPWKTAMGIAPQGQFFGNGEGMLLYPPAREMPKEPVIEGPVNSIRWELLREGLEDREYFWLLGNEMERLEKEMESLAGDSREQAKRVLAQARDAMSAPDRLARSLTDYTKDPQDLFRERESLALAIEACLRIGRRR